MLRFHIGFSSFFTPKVFNLRIQKYECDFLEYGERENTVEVGFSFVKNIFVLASFCNAWIPHFCSNVSSFDAISFSSLVLHY